MSKTKNTLSIEKDIIDMSEVTDLLTLEEAVELAELIDLRGAVISEIGVELWYEGVDIHPDSYILDSDPEIEPLEDNHGARDIDGTTEWKD